MKSIIKLPITCGVLTILSLVTSVAFAEENTFSGLKVGINAIYSDKGFTDYDNDISILPSVFYDNGMIYARGNNIGYNLIKDNQNELSVLAQYGGVSFDNKNANNAFKGLDDRDASVFFGASYLRITPIGGFRAQVTKDLLGDSDGTLARLTYLGKYKEGNITLVPSVGLQWQDDKYNDYYYGVTEQESSKTGIKGYSASDSVHPYVSVMGMYDMNKDWTLFLNQNLAYNSSEIHDSPKIDERTQFTSTLGLMYNF